MLERSLSVPTEAKAFSKLSNKALTDSSFDSLARVDKATSKFEGLAT
jgi:hypothetical protein